MRWREFTTRYFSLNAPNVERLVGLTMIAKGLLLFFDIHYFFYPSGLKSVMNNNLLDVAIVLIGAVLFTLTYVRCKTMKAQEVKIFIIKILMSLAAFFFLTLAISQILHGIFTPEHRMAHTALGDLFIFAIIDLTASVE